MAKSCKDCIHSGVCVLCQLNETCLAFKNKADVVEVRHGEWRESDTIDDGWRQYRCNECGWTTGCYYKEICDLPRYCQNCGAKMDGGSDDV